MACIAVSCTPGTFQSCRGDQVLTCNAVGNDYDVAQCEHGCDNASQGCVSCLSSAECANPTPTCDLPSHGCRACVSDSECDSEVCDVSGACVDPSAVLYASPEGSPAGDCGSQTTPCSFARVFTLLDSTHQTVKLRAGDYTSETQVPVVASAGQTVVIDGPAAVIHTTIADAAFNFTGPGRLDVRGLTFSIVVGGSSHSSNFGVSCGDFRVSAASELVADGLTFLGGGDFIDLSNCNATVTRSRFVGNTSSNPLFLVNQHSVLTLDRCWLEANPQYPVPSIYTSDVRDNVGARVHVRNSVFLHTDDMFVTQGIVDVDHSTFVDQVRPIDCMVDTEGGNHGKRVYTNVLVVSTHGQSSVAHGTPCELHYSLLFPQVDLEPNSDHMLLNMDPKLVDIAHGDYHLSAVSPAIDAADPTSMLPIDHDGHARPEGPRTDIGAFEFAP